MDFPGWDTGITQGVVGSQSEPRIHKAGSFLWEVPFGDDPFELPMSFAVWDA